MSLPQTYRTELGFTVDGASPALLRNLLDDFATALVRVGVPVDTLFRPGRPEAEVCAECAGQGLVPTEELIIWWGWRDGVTQGLPAEYFPRDFLSLERSMQNYDDEDKGLDVALWNPSWVRLAGHPRGIAVLTDPAMPPLVRGVHKGGFGTNDVGTTSQVVSLCTPVTWWILAIANGWWRWIPAADGFGHWEYARDSLPLEWQFTSLV
ncbi:hypothetical protein [Galbitalea soli]|uniref:SMI1/KNR4 family protein n=1 Tax=Galbitalea soli TaxID=1268042 RepID=A0A7C9PPE9_9MICO|nr:hypothetical protein [Galbitalea soli]NEM92312.1 hypothetical protein [Galbitalea soli]NYJ31732.1 hypothetical protein [Galbitalea soli]